MTTVGALSICMVSDDFLPAATGVGTHIKLLAPELVHP
jgi:1,2-diacylglycerol 3-alpha-glucosyltransferase